MNNTYNLDKLRSFRLSSQAEQHVIGDNDDKIKWRPGLEYDRAKIGVGTKDTQLIAQVATGGGTGVGVERKGWAVTTDPFRKEQPNVSIQYRPSCSIL